MELRSQFHIYVGTAVTMSQVMRWLAGPNATPIIFLCYLLPRIAILFLDVEPTSDAEWYLHSATGLAIGSGYVEGGVPTAYWPPGWPLALAAVFKLLGTSVWAGQIFNVFCALAIAWFTLDIGRRLVHSEIAGRAALLLLAIYPNSIGYVALLLTEVFYTTLLLAGCWILIVLQGVRRIVLGGLLFGLATLVKAQSLVVIPLIFGIAILRDWRGLRHVVINVTMAASVIAIALLFLLPWGLRNHAVFGEWIFVSTNGGLTLLTGNNPSARGGYTPDDPLVKSISRSVATQVSVDKEARRRAVEWIKENPDKFIGLMPLKLFRLWAPDGESEWGFQAGYKHYDQYAFWFRAVRYLNQAYYACLLLGFAWAGVLLVFGKERISPHRIDWWALPYAIAFYPTTIAMVFSGQSRFHYPVMPFIAMTCGWLLVIWCANEKKPLQGEKA
jgi:hypothetical protein